MQNDNYANDDVIEIDLQELFGLLLHWLWLIILCGIAAGAVGFVLSRFVIVPQYESTTSVYILSKNDNNSLTYSDTQLATQLTKDYEKLITSRYVLEQVIDQFQLEEGYGSLSGKITVNNASGTRIIDITVKDPDPELAQMLADAIRDISATHITSVMNIEAVNIVDRANLPTAPSEPSVPKWTLLGAVIGVFLCAVILVVRFLLDDTIKSSEDIEKYLGLSTLALIPDAELEEKRSSKERKLHKSSRRQTEAEPERTERREIKAEKQHNAEPKAVAAEPREKTEDGDMEIIEYTEEN